MSRSFPPDVAYRRRWWTLTVLCVGVVVISIDNTILNVALPTIQDDLSATNTQLQWIVDSYTLVFAGLLLTMGTLGDRFGRKRALAFGLAWFGAFSLISGFADDPVQLIVSRALMGVGGAAILPATLSIITNVFVDPTERVRAIAIWAAVMGAGTGLGPLAGGILIEIFGAWEPVFWVNVPIVIIALVGGHYVIPPSKDPTEPRFDLLGATLSILGLFGIVYAIIEAPIAPGGWTDPRVLTALGLGVVFLVGFVVWERHCKHPMLDLRVFKNMRFTAASVALMLVFFALMGAVFLFTQYLQNVEGYSALEAGVRTLPISLAIVILSPISARFDLRYGSKATIALALGLIGVGYIMSSFFAVGTPYWYFLVATSVLGVGMGLTMPSATNSIMGSVPRERAGVGSAMNDTTRLVGGALGVAVLGSVLTSRYTTNLDASLDSLPDSVQRQIAGIRDLIESSIAAAVELGQKALARGAPRSVVDEITAFAKAAFVDGQRLAMYIGAGAALIGVVITLIWLPARGEEQPPLVLDDDGEASTPAPSASR